jgi:serpin B
VIFSPINIAAALSMAMAGSRGDTQREFSAVLHRTDNSAAYDQSIAALAAQLANAGNNAGNVLTQANALWVQNGFRILPDFANILSSSYGAPPAPLDFAHNAETARAAINQWTSDHTKGRIADLFPPGSITALDRLVLTAAIYFNGKWQTPFLAARTQPATFHNETGAAQQTPFMNQTGQFRYAEVPGAQVLQMPYAGGSLTFDAILPTETEGLAKIEASMTPENLTAWFAQLANADVQVAMPKFTNKAGFSLNQTLAKMGLANAFTRAADFSGIDGKHDLSISEVMHRAFIAVDEQGTEAAAATGVAIAVRAVRRPEPKVFRADHPFAYFIRDTASGAILFAGRMAKP